MTDEKKISINVKCYNGTKKIKNYLKNIKKKS